MPRLTKVPVAMVLIGLTLALPGPARASIDDDWALINSCAKLRAFQAKHGSSHRYSGHVAARSARLGCDAPHGPPKIYRPGSGQTSTSTPRPPRPPAALPAPIGRERVVLAPTGGDTSDLLTALKMVRPNGLITVYPGNYSASIDIFIPVRIEGLPGRWKDTVLTGKLGIGGSATDVRLANLTFEGGAPGNILTVLGKFSCDSCLLRGQQKESANNLGDMLIYVDGAGEIHLLHSRLDSLGNCAISSCYSLVLNSVGHRNTIVDSLLTHRWSAVYIEKGDLLIWTSKFEGVNGSSVFRPAGSGSLEISDSAFSNAESSKFYSISVRQPAGFTLRNNLFKTKYPSAILLVGGTAYPDISRYPGGNRVAP